MDSRDIKSGSKELQERYDKFASAMAAAGLKFKLTHVSRSILTQAALYAQGRKQLAEVNAMRKAVGMPPLTAEQNKRPVTWTMNSKHVVGDKRQLSDAFDIVLAKDENNYHYDTKLSVNKNTIPDYIEAGHIGESVGLKWGGRFKNKLGLPRPDYPHFEV